MKRIIILAVLVPLLASCLSVGGRRVDTVPTIGIIVSEYMNFEREMAVAAAERLAYDHGGTFITRDWTLDKGDAFTIEIIEFPDAEEGLFLETVGNFSVIVTLNYSYSILLERHHMDFPETHFIGIHSWFPDLSDDANVTIVHGNFIEGGFCAGVAAALSGANTVGYIGAEEEGPRGGGFLAGAVYANRQFQLPEHHRLAIVGSWDDHERGYAVASEMYQDGVDIIFTDAGGSNEGVYRAAVENDKMVIGLKQTDWNHLTEDPPIREILGDKLTALLEERLDNIIYLCLETILRGDRIPERYSSFGLEDDTWRLEPNPYNIPIIEEAGRIVGEAAEFIIKGELQLPHNPHEMGFYIDRLHEIRDEAAFNQPPEHDTAPEPAPAPEGPLPIVSVMDLTLEKISSSEGLLIVDLLSSALIETQKYTVIDRAQRKAILDEIAFSLEGCTDESCQLEVGRLLAADKIIVGSTGLIGTKYILNLKLVDVETSAAVRTAYKIFNSLDDMVEGIGPTAMELSR